MNNTDPYALFGDIANTVVSTSVNALQAALPVVLPIVALFAGIKYVLKSGSITKLFKK
jgi:hypothetical protein